MGSFHKLSFPPRSIATHRRYFDPAWQRKSFLSPFFEIKRTARELLAWRNIPPPMSIHFLQSITRVQNRVEYLSSTSYSWYASLLHFRQPGSLSLNIRRVVDKNSTLPILGLCTFDNCPSLEAPFLFILSCYYFRQLSIHFVNIRYV